MGSGEEGKDEDAVVEKAVEERVRTLEECQLCGLPRGKGIPYTRWIYTHSIACAIAESYRPHIGRPCIVIHQAEWTTGTVRRIRSLRVDEQDIEEKGW